MMYNRDKLYYEDEEIEVRFEVELHLENGRIHSYVTYGNTTFCIEQKDDGSGWNCYLHDKCDPRRKLAWHPCKTGKSAWELANYPLFLGSCNSPLYPSAKVVYSWYRKSREIDLKGNPYAKRNTWADILQPYIDHPLLDDEWSAINDHYQHPTPGKR